MGRLGRYSGQVVDGALSLLDRHAPHVSYKLKRHFYRPDMEFGLRLLRKSGFDPKLAIDVGAYHGEWAHQFRSVFPGAKVLMIEPSPERVELLSARCARDPMLQVEGALLGAADATVPFLEQETNSSVVAEPSAFTRPMTQRRLDALVAGTEFASSELLKLDVQGYELEVLAGAELTLRSVQVLVIELSIIPLSVHAPSFREAIDWLDDHGLRLLDICGFMRRPVDDALWQVDAIFARPESGLGSPKRGW